MLIVLLLLKESTITYVIYGFVALLLVSNCIDIRIKENIIVKFIVKIGNQTMGFLLVHPLLIDFLKQINTNIILKFLLYYVLLIPLALVMNCVIEFVYKVIIKILLIEKYCKTQFKE